MIPGFYTDEFVQELNRRHELMWGRSLLETYHFEDLDAANFIQWMSNSWGQPRREWQQLGPIDAWRYGSNWEKVVSDKHVREALKHPKILQDEATRLFNAIRNADYEQDSSHWRTFPAPDVNYRAAMHVDRWMAWTCREFKQNPIKSVQLGEEVYLNDRQLPTLRYTLVRADGSELKGELPFEYLPKSECWTGVEGLDWHLKN